VKEARKKKKRKKKKTERRARQAIIHTQTNTNDNIVFISLIAFFVITISCLARSYPKQDSQYVWKTFVNTSGWSSDGIVFLTGLVNPNFIYSGLDGAIHLAEECTNAAVAIPWALVSTVVVGFVTAFSFAVSMTYSYHDFDAVLASP
jgi:choline transport protein